MAPTSAVAKQLSAKVSLTELLTRTMRQDWWVFLLGTLFFFACQFAAKFLMNRASKKFRSLSEDDKNTWCVRFVASVNSVVCMFSLPLQYRDGALAKNPASVDAETGYPSLYEPMPFPQKYFFEVLSSYFIYDIIVCWYYSWGAAYLVHGIVSFTGVYTVAWPFAERYASYMGAMFESSGLWLHGAEMLVMIDGPPGVIMAMKAIFSALFLLIRPIGGTIVAWQFTRSIYHECVTNSFEHIHHPAAVGITLFVTWGLMALQLYWTKDVITGILVTLGVMQDRDFGDAKSPTKRNVNTKEFPRESKKHE